MLGIDHLEQSVFIFLQSLGDPCVSSVRKRLCRARYSVLIERLTIRKGSWRQRIIPSCSQRMRCINSRTQSLNEWLSSSQATETCNPPIHVNPPEVLYRIFFNINVHLRRSAIQGFNHPDLCGVILCSLSTMTVAIRAVDLSVFSLYSNNRQTVDKNQPFWTVYQ